MIPDTSIEGTGSVAVVGGGIRGLTLALALEQRGIRATVYEGSPRLREVGAGIWIPPNAMKVFGRLGVAGAIASAGMPVKRMEVMTHHGSLLRSVDLETVRRELRTETVSIHRGRLQRILAERLPAGRLRPGHRCNGLEPTGRKLDIRFDGDRRVEAGTVVGADGIHSVCREHVAPGTPVLDLPPLPTWHSERTVLLGDAAHAMTPNPGQGGAQAIEDAWVLAECLARRRPEGSHVESVEQPGPTPAFREYEERRRGRAEQIARISRWTGRMAQIASPPGRALRDVLLRRLPRWLEASQSEKLYRVPESVRLDRGPAPGDPHSASG